MKPKAKLVVELLAICGFDLEQEDRPLEKPHFVSYGCKRRTMLNDEWDDPAEFEEAKQRMKAEVEESLVDLVMNEDASFFVFSTDLNMLAAVSEALEVAISARVGREAEGEEFVARMKERRRYDDKIILEGARS